MGDLLDTIDYKRYAILYVDDEEQSLKYFRRAFEDSFQIFTAPNAEQGYATLCREREHIGVLLTDQRMPGETGIELLEKARKLDPSILRILVTAFSDVETAVDSVNSGAVFHYLSKPWDPEPLERMLKRCLEYFTVQSQRDQLLHEKLNIVQSMLRGDRAESMTILASGLNHHMRNSLTSIKTFVDLVPLKIAQELPEQGHYQDGEFWTSYHGQVGQQVQRMITILERLWDASSEKELRFESDVDFQEIVANTLTAMDGELSQQAIAVSVSIPKDLPSITSNRVKLGQLIRLILQDSLTHLEPGQEIHLQADAETLHPQDPATPCLHLSVTDQAPAVADSDLDHLFDPFFQRGDDPSVLGTDLMACYHIVHLHGGHIEARNDSEGHTAIHIFLPLAQTETHASTERDLAARIGATEALWERLQQTETQIR